METSDLPFFADPRTDGQRLFNMQYEYKRGDAAALDRMYRLLFTIAHKAINKRAAGSKKLRELSDDERRQKAHDAATYVIEQYIKRDDFVRTDSITGYLFKCLPRVLYGEHENKRDQIVVYTDELPEKSSARVRYKYIAHNDKTGEAITYASAAELYLNAEFRCLRKKRLAECVRTGRPWKFYRFELLEVNE